MLEAFAVWRVGRSLPSVDKDTNGAHAGGAGRLASTVVLCAAVLLGFRDVLRSYEGMRNLGDAALLLPVALFALEWKSLLSGWHIRNNDLGAISGATIVESVVIVLVGVGAGAIGMLTFGQPAARTLSIAAATGVVLYSSRDLIDACRAVSRAQLVYTWRQFRSETTWSTMVALVNTTATRCRCCCSRRTTPVTRWGPMP
ncbi:MAG: hypothetical protein R2755_28080 [Acidimicrobiales bacterium]